MTKDSEPVEQCPADSGEDDVVYPGKFTLLLFAHRMNVN